MAGFSRASVMQHPLESKFCGNENFSSSGAFALDETVTFRIRVPDMTEAAAMLLRRDGEDTAKEIPLASDGAHHYAVRLSMASLGGENGGLYFYQYRVSGAYGTFHLTRYPDTLNDAYEDGQSARIEYLLLVYRRREHLPSWFYGGILYQIFPDRFCEGNPVKKEEIAAKKGGIFCRESEAFPNQMRMQKQNRKNNLFFGGDLDGISQKLDYLVSLGVTALYLNPIFSSPSNHRYNTSNYAEIDEMLGGEGAFRRLLDSASEHGIRVILDGVFNHTGSDSVYFNTHGHSSVPGAAESVASPYYPWYHFHSYPDSYDSWWGIRTLPRVMSDEESYRHFLFSENGILRHYLREGIAGWRLDVADELSDDFLRALKAAAVKETPDALVIGEVWEDATTKVSYGVRRRYLVGDEVDSVMNYPLRTALIGYLTEGDFMTLRRALLTIYGNYPPEAANALMNLLDTHDTPRILTALAGIDENAISYDNRTDYRMDKDLRRTAMARLHLAVAIQMVLPGVPCIYYGDEAGMEGFGDPFCRMPYPWGKEDERLLSFYRKIGQIRRAEPIFQEGRFALVFTDAEILCFERQGRDENIVLLVNRSADAYDFEASSPALSLWSGETATRFTIPPEDFGIYKVRRHTDYTVCLKKELTE